VPEFDIARTLAFVGLGKLAVPNLRHDARCDDLGGAFRPRKLVYAPSTTEAVAVAPKVHTVVVLEHTGGEVALTEGRDRTWAEVTAGESDDASTCPCEPMDSEDLLYDDAVFGVRESLIVDFAPDETGELAATFNFVLDRA